MVVIVGTLVSVSVIFGVLYTAENPLEGRRSECINHIKIMLRLR